MSMSPQPDDPQSPVSQTNQSGHNINVSGQGNYVAGGDIHITYTELIDQLPTPDISDPKTTSSLGPTRARVIFLLLHLYRRRISCTILIASILILFIGLPSFLRPWLDTVATQDSTQTAIADAAIAQTFMAQTVTAASVEMSHTPTPSQTPISNLSPTPTLFPETPVVQNIDWTPIEQDFDGVTMVLVPAGCFQMGTNDLPNARPVHEQCFDAPFWIDKYEVANEQFDRFNGVAGKMSSIPWPDRPRENITWLEARDFCVLRGARLPTEREWEYAARGPSNWIYPWGDSWDEDKVVWQGNANSETAAVGSRPDGKSWVGALDMSGNVRELTSSLYMQYPYVAGNSREDDTDQNAMAARVLRGGSAFDDASEGFRADHREAIDPLAWYYNFGFRCAKSVASN